LEYAVVPYDAASLRLLQEGYQSIRPSYTTAAAFRGGVVRCDEPQELIFLRLFFCGQKLSLWEALVMSMIKVEHLTFSYPSSRDSVFENVNFQIDTDWKLGLIGRNGRGKTTLLHLLLGKYAYGGKIISAARFDYFPYPVADPGRLTKDILREICPRAQEWEYMRELALLNVEAGALGRSFDALSHGEQTKVLLAALFLHENHFLLIDEPTNHLDSQARELVSAYLRRKKGFILVSHDRRFLDGCVDHILSLNRSNIEVRNGNFTSWLENFERRQEAELAQNKHLQRDIKSLRQSARRTAAWSDRVEKTKIGASDKGFIGHKAAKMMKRAKSIEARQMRCVQQKEGLLKNLETAGELQLRPLRHYANTLVSYEDVSVWYEGESICAPVSFTVGRGERVALEGKNGSGKSSLLKLLLGYPIAYTGTITAASGLLISYVPQDASYLRGSLRGFAEENGIDQSLFQTVLRKMGVERAEFEKDMGDFSAGQKKKVLVAKSLCEKAHLYVWDEPLNFLDIYARMQMEKLLHDFAASMVFVEHDRAFQEAAATKIVRI